MLIWRCNGLCRVCTYVCIGVHRQRFAQFWLKVERPSTLFGAASVTIRYELSFGFLPAQVITTYIYCLLSRMYVPGLKHLLWGDIMMDLGDVRWPLVKGLCTLRKRSAHVSHAGWACKGNLDFAGRQPCSGLAYVQWAWMLAPGAKPLTPQIFTLSYVCRCCVCHDVVLDYVQAR